MAAEGKGIDLANLFQAVTGQLQSNKDSLNKADQYNHDHGDNMVDIFAMITKAMNEKKGASPADQLSYASKIVGQKQSGSSQLYAGGLGQAAKEFIGKKYITPNDVITLAQTIMSGGQSPAKPQQQQQSGGLGGILGSLFGGGKSASTAQPAGGTVQQDPIAALLAQLPPGWRGTVDPSTGDIRMESPHGFEPVSPRNLPDYVAKANRDAAAERAKQAPAEQPSGGVDYITGSVLEGGSTTWTAQQREQQLAEGLDFASGGQNLASIVNTLVSNSASNSGYRKESGSIVASTLMQAIQGMINKK